MKPNDIAQFETRIKALSQGLADLASDREFHEFLVLIRKPGWTTVAELALVTGLVDVMIAQTASLAASKQTLLTGSRAVSVGHSVLPTPEEIDAMTEFSSHESECEVLCEELQDVADELPGATGMARRRLVARMRAINMHMRALHCKICLPQ